ncbi:uncharacterized protein [Neodiprion pinetum]|uniref:uncharacterized protein isoform X1 n=1 Tax=Neodiprion pinetum TaxID=441929 RepID=UPI001EE08AAD|nr:uncharacterized protein LOC124215066 isoform X1 [Neodiprion pinetum]
MNNNEKNSHTNNDTTNARACSIAIPKEQSIRHSLRLQENPHFLITAKGSQLGYGTHDKTNTDVSTAITTPLPENLIEKSPHVNENLIKDQTYKHWPEKFNKVVPRSVEKPRGRVCDKQEGKNSKILISNDKSEVITTCKRQSRSTGNREILKNKSNDCQKTSCRISRETKSPKVKEVSCNTVLSSVPRIIPQQAPRHKGQKGKEGILAHCTEKVVKKVKKKQDVHFSKKTSAKADMQEKIELDKQRIKKNIENLKKSYEAKKKYCQKIVEIKNLQTNNARDNNDCINAKNENNGAARTRIFNLKKSIQMDKNFSTSKIESNDVNSAPETQHKNEPKSKASDPTNLNCTKCCIDSTRNTIQSSKDVKICCEKDVSKTAEIESIANLIEPSNCDCNRLKQLLVANKFSSISEDKIMYNANSINYGCYSDQPYRKGPNKQQDYRNYAINADIKLTKLEKDKSTVNDDAKYNLMKTLIHPASEINGSQGLNNNTIKFSLYKHQSKDGLANCKDEKTQDVYKNSGSSNSTVNVETASLSNIVTQLPDNMSKMESYETLNAAKITAYLKHPSSSNTSDKIISNLKTNGYKYSKKYRRFNHKEKNMCCNMARYIERMVSNEKKYQKHEKKIDPERKNVKIIIDENSPKTSRIRIVNDRSSVSVVCHGSEKTTSPSRRSNNTAAKNTESSGGESSGYKSYHNDLHKRHFDHSDQAKMNSTEHQQIEHVTERKFHNTQTILYHNINDDRFESISSPLDDPVNTQFVGIRENIKSHQNLCEEKLKKRDTETKYTLYDTNKYLSAFTNSLDMYLPCEITAYQMKEVNRSKVFQFNNPELEEKDVDNAEMRIGKYLIENSSDSRDELSEEEESSEQLNSARDAKIDKDKVIVLKKPNNAVQRSLEYVVSKRFLDLNNAEGQDSFIHIPTVPAQHKIITSLQDVKHEEIREAFETSRSTTDLTSALAHNKAAERVKSSISDIETGSGNPKLYLVDKKIVMGTDPGYKRIKCSKRLKIKNENLYDSNKVYELWANSKSTANSTDNESQTTRRFICAPSDSKRCRTNKFKFNIFKKIKSCKSEKTTHIPLDQLPKPPSSFLESSAPSQSTMLSSTADTDYWESDTVLNLHKGATLLLHTNPATKTYTDPTHINHSKRNHITASPEENHDHLHLQSNNRASTSHKDTETYLQSSPAHPMNEKQLTAPHALHTAAPPPPSALPPPYPFCCPFVPYMMQYWQNYQQPPPASKLPLPDGDWQPTVRKNGNEPPPPDMVPIPWFPPMSNVHDHPPRAEMNFTTSNNIHAQPPPEWLMMPRGYAPCFPCSNTTESYLRKTDSSVCKDDEPPVEISENKQDEKKKTVSSKLFKIFRRKNRAEMDTLDDDGKKGKYHRSGSEAKLVRKVRVVENEENNTNGQSIWESPDIAGIVTPEEIGRCFRRGFRADGLTLAGDEYVCTRTPSDTTSEQEEIFNFSDHDTPLDFLLALGFSVDEATAAIRDDEVRNRFKAALTEARIWVPHIATTQGTLLYLLAMKAKPKVMRYFLQLVESIVNKRITNAVKLDAYLKILEKVEEGYVSFVTLFGKDKGNEDDEDTAMMEKQRRRIFYTIYKYAEAEAEEVGKPMTNASVDLLQSLATRYRSAIGPHLQLLACYIGEGLLTKDVQLEAALIYLSRLDSTDVRLTDLEKYCGMPVSERRRLEQGVKMLS